MIGRDEVVALLMPHWRASHGEEALWIGCGDGWLEVLCREHADQGGSTPTGEDVAW